MKNPTIANGRRANLITFGNPEGNILGTYRQTGAYTWVENNAKNQISSYFIERQRHNGAVYLYDPSRYVALELNLNNNKIISTDNAGKRLEQHHIINVNSKVNGWVANRVAFRFNDGLTTGEYRQTGENTWVELNQHEQVTNRFKETKRDEWSVYLHDASRNIRIQLNMHTEKVISTDLKNRSENFSIERTSSDPANVFVTSPLPVKSQNVNTVAFGSLNGQPLGYYRQTGESSWAEVGNNHQVNFTFNEVRRDHDSVYLNDPTRKISLQINLSRQRIIYTNPANTRDLYAVLRTSATLNGWIVSELTFGSFAGAELGKYRQTEAKAWVELDKAGNVVFQFAEAGREDWSIFLHDTSRDVALQLDLHSQSIIYGRKGQSGRKLYKIISESVEPGIWLHSEKITSRSSLTEDFQVDATTKELVSSPVYRTSVSVTTVTGFVDVWASEQVTVEINGSSYTIDPVKSARVIPNQFSKLSISIPATDVRCPNLLLRTNLMMPEQRHYIFPDVEAHKKIVGMKEGDLYKAREDLGIPDQYSKEDVNHFQQALQNIAKTVQHTYNKTTHGVHHDRALLPVNMKHPHFVVQLGGEGPVYRPLHPSEVPQHIAGARLIQADAAQGFFDEIGHFFKKAATIVVHTVENVGHDIVQTVENIGSDVVHTVHQVGEDIVHGDIGHIGQDLMQGGENIGSDLVKGAGNVMGDAVSGAEQLVVITLKAADEAVQFVITHTGVVGRVLGELFKKIGAELSKVVDWLLDKIGWSDVLHTHDVLFDSFNNKLDEAKTYPGMLKQQADKFFTHLSDVISDDIDKALDQFDVLKLAKQPQPVQSHSGAVEKIEWLLGKFAQNSTGAASLAFPALPVGHDSALGNLFTLVEQQLGSDGKKIQEAIENAIGDVSEIFSNPNHTPEYLLGAVLEIVKAVAILGLDAIKTIFDALMDLLEAIVNNFKELMNTPWHIPFISDLYESLTESHQMSFLSFTCLLISIPTTIIYKAEYNTPPFKSQTVGAQLEDIPDNLRAFSMVYGVCHIILAPVSVLADIRSAINAFKAQAARRLPDAPIDQQFEQSAINLAAPAAPNKYLSEGAGGLLTILNLGVNAIAQTMGNPIPANEHYRLPDPSTKFDVLEAPNYWSHVIWLYQWFGWGFNVGFAVPTAGKGIVGASDMLSSGFEYVATIFNTAYGITHMALMGVLDVADRNKAIALANDLANINNWTQDQRNYYKWASNESRIDLLNSVIPADSPLPRKGFGNVMDSFPEIGQFGAIPYFVEGSEGFSLIFTGFMDTLGQLGEGITVIVRTTRNELL